MEAWANRFTASEGGTRLAGAARAQNTLATEHTSFVATRLLHESAYQIRGSLFDGQQRSIYVTRASRVDFVAFELSILTDLSVVKAIKYDDIYDWYAEIDKKEVVVCTSAVFKQILEEEVLNMANINILILDSCHLIYSDENIQYIMKVYKQYPDDERPRILALTYPLFTSPKKDSQQTIDGNADDNVDEMEVNNKDATTDSDSNINTHYNKDAKVEETEIETKNDVEEIEKDNENEADEKETENSAKAENETKEKASESEGSKAVDKTEGLIEELIKDKDSAAESKTDLKTMRSRNEKSENFEDIGVFKNLDDFDMYKKLEWKIEQLERDLCCQMDLAEDVEGGKRLSASVSKPKELIIEYSKRPDDAVLPEQYIELEKFMRDTVKDAMEWLDEHRYDPTEIYGDELYEEFMNIPNPTVDPKCIFRQFLYILEQLGPYAADKAAFSLLAKLEKLKIKVPYERHFLLLCLCTSVFVKVRCYADIVFSQCESDWEKMKLFCTPKVLRFAEILEKFQPPDHFKESRRDYTENSASNVENSNNNVEKSVNTDENSDTIVENSVGNVEKSAANIEKSVDNVESVDNVNNESNKDKMLNDIDKCDFITLSNKIEDKVNTYAANLKEIIDMNVENEKNSAERNKKESLIKENSPTAKDNHGDNSKNGNAEVLDFKTDGKGVLGFPRRSGHRSRGRGRLQRGNTTRVQQMQQNPDALCGIVFMREALMAKILFMLIVDMSRCNPKLSYLCAQYCAVEKPADPGTEPKECQRQGKKQEEVLKKFRMHECNLLLATSALEEGIDLPRCNLVVRWDTPASYRSFGLCRGRARAARSCCVLLSDGASGESDTLLHNVATYKELDQIISRKCGCGIQNEPPQTEEDHADAITTLIKPYSPGYTNQKEDKRTKSKLQNKNVDTNNCEITDIAKNNEFPNTESNVVNELDNNGQIISANIIKDNIIVNNVANENVLCNKCKAKRVDVEVDCPCVSDKSDDVCGEKSDNMDASVDLSTAIALINRYCGKLPSDTFTRLAPQWWMEEVQLPVRGSTETRKAYICTLRLPLNCPVKYNIVGHPMPTRALARRMVALQACRILHKSGELDNQLMPIGKENFKAAELENVNCDNGDEPGDARPGTTKRRQYYFKRTALAFTDCQPVVDTSDSEIDPPGSDAPKIKVNSETVKNTDKGRSTKRNMLYAIVSKLWCALPERYNTRGRRLHAPQNAAQALAILMARDEPDALQIPSFPVYTRSGEVRVSVEHVPDADVRVSPRRGRLVRRFMRFIFAEVLRVRRRGMKLQSEGTTHNNYYIVPTIKTKRQDGSTKIDIDWAFLELIYQHTEEKKHSEVEKPLLWHQDEEEEEEFTKKSEAESGGNKEKDGKVKAMENPLLKPGETFVFDPEKYKEAVVTPWYRNQDQPQFFLVAEICWHLSPESAFPSAAHSSFRGYYGSKYGARLTQPRQPLLDVDHTSARLNLLTPRYVNRKGVALPVSSERTRRAKRDRLDQKQILVPELCRVHPFAAPLWFATVALPCVLYRINALLIADEIRRSVAIDVGLGIPKIDEHNCPGFEWPPLDFGWSLAEVLNSDAEKSEKKKEEDDGTSREDREGELGEKEEKERLEGYKEEEKSEELKEKTLNDILQEKEATEPGFEIGTWSNDMAYSIPDSTEYDECMEPLPPNLTFCTSASGGTNWCDPIEKPKNQFQPSRIYSMADSDCSYMSSDFDTDDSDLNSEGSDEDTDTSGFCSSKNSNAAMGVRIEYRTAHEAEAVEVRGRGAVCRAPRPSAARDRSDRAALAALLACGPAPPQYVEKFRSSVAKHKKEFMDKGFVDKDSPITEILPETTRDNLKSTDKGIEQITSELSKIYDENKKLIEVFPYGIDESFLENGQVTLVGIEKNKRKLLAELKESLPVEEVKKLNCFSMLDVDIDSPSYVNEKIVNIGFDNKENYIDKVSKWDSTNEFIPYYNESKTQNGKDFDFDYQPNLEGHRGPSPSVILQALTMSNANDGINLERLETIGDSFLKFAITAYLYCAHPTVHEGKLSHMRSKQVSNLNLYRLGRNKRLGARMIASKFEPHDNWLPPCHKPPPTLHPRLADSQDQPSNAEIPLDSTGCFIPYNLITQHSIPDKSIADCVEALIGAYLLECGPRGALLFMSWLGIKVLPRHDLPLPEDHPYVRKVEAGSGTQQQQPIQPAPRQRRVPCEAQTSDSDSEGSSEDEGGWRERYEPSPEPDWGWPGRPVGSLRPYRADSGQWLQPIFGELRAPPSPLLRYIEDPEGELERMLSGYDALERTLRYRFRDRSLLLQALTHASHFANRLTDCYQRLEFLGDAILDYLITRHLFEDRRRHSPGALTDLRSALVNNTIFATLAARHGFHKYFRHMSPGLNEVLTKYVTIQEENGHSISEEHYLIQEDEMEQAEDVEVPKALGDLFESVAGAIFLDSGMSLDAVWKSYVNLMGAELEAFSAAAPKSPVRELLEAEPDTAKFGKPERLADGRRVRVCVEVFGRGAFKGIGRNYRIAKGTAARCALRHLKKHRAH